MRVSLLVLAAFLIVLGDILILAIARTLPDTVFAGRLEWACAAVFLILGGVGLAVWANLRHAA